ncbi:NAC-alpha domain-containing protein 1-like, partial [Oxyura jamaicensis]|uniref:NAC-alpha domain-containing protein 1-like n=1 Tax=Oxyura jamaicensis TaxID=8884 RepID=UPI0015A56D16
PTAPPGDAAATPMPTKEEARPQPEGASCDAAPGPSAPDVTEHGPPAKGCRPPPPPPPPAPPALPADPLDTRIVMGEETSCPPKTPPEPPSGRPPAGLDPELFFTAPSTPVRTGGARPKAEEDGGDAEESEGLGSPPTSPSGSYMTAEGGSWGSSGTASTSPSCSPNLLAEAPDGEAGPAAFTHRSPSSSSSEDEASAGQEEEEDEEDEGSGQAMAEEGSEVAPGGLIPAALLPFRGSLLFEAEAVEITLVPAEAAAEPLSGEEEEDEEEDEEEEEDASTSASFLRSLSETSINEGVDESFAFRDDTSASSDSASYDGEEDERLYGTERHALGGTATATPGDTEPSSEASGDIELHLRGGGTARPDGTGSGSLTPGGDERASPGESPRHEAAPSPPGLEAPPDTEEDPDNGGMELGMPGVEQDGAHPVVEEEDEEEEEEEEVVASEVASVEAPATEVNVEPMGEAFSSSSSSSSSSEDSSPELLDTSRSRTDSSFFTAPEDSAGEAAAPGLPSPAPRPCMALSLLPPASAPPPLRFTASEREVYVGTPPAPLELLPPPPLGALPESAEDRRHVATMLQGAFGDLPAPQRAGGPGQTPPDAATEPPRPPQAEVEAAVATPEPKEPQELGDAGSPPRTPPACPAQDEEPPASPGEEPDAKVPAEGEHPPAPPEQQQEEEEVTAGSGPTPSPEEGGEGGEAAPSPTKAVLVPSDPPAEPSSPEDRAPQEVLAVPAEVSVPAACPPLSKLIQVPPLSSSPPRSEDTSGLAERPEERPSVPPASRKRLEAPEPSPQKEKARGRKAPGSTKGARGPEAAEGGPRRAPRGSVQSESSSSSEAELPYRCPGAAEHLPAIALLEDKAAPRRGEANHK